MVELIAGQLYTVRSDDFRVFCYPSCDSVNPTDEMCDSDICTVLSSEIIQCHVCVLFHGALTHAHISTYEDILQRVEL